MSCVRTASLCVALCGRVGLLPSLLRHIVPLSRQFFVAPQTSKDLHICFLNSGHWVQCFGLNSSAALQLCDAAAPPPPSAPFAQYLFTCHVSPSFAGNLCNWGFSGGCYLSIGPVYILQFGAHVLHMDHTA